MPTLPKPFTAQIGGAQVGGGRRASAEDFGSSGFSDIGETVRRGVDSFVAQREEDESRTALVKTTEIRARYAKALDEASISGADLGSLREKMDAELSAIGEKFMTTRGSDQLAVYSSNTNMMFDEQANRVNVQRAFAESKLQGQQFLVNVGKLLAANPGYLPVAEKDAEAFANSFLAIRPDQRAEMARMLKGEVNQQAANLAIRADPVAAEKALENGQWELTPDQRTQLLATAKAGVNGKRIEDERVRQIAERERLQASEAARDNYFIQLQRGATKVDGKSINNAILDDPRLTARDREHVYQLMKAQVREGAAGERRSDPTVFKTMWLAANAPADDPNRMLTTTPIVEAVAAGQLNMRDADYLMNQVRGQKDADGRTFGARKQQVLAGVERAIKSSPMFTAQPELQNLTFNELALRADQTIEKLREAGDVKGLREVFDPKSPNYIGSPQAIKEATDAARRTMLGTGGAAAPQAGEEVVRPDGRWRFKGGDPREQKNWEKLTSGAKPAAAAPAPTKADGREFDSALEARDPELQRLGTLSRFGSGTGLNTESYIKYVDRLKQLRAGQ